ncbi:MAG: hypothetical protein K6E33_04490 [Lachnospiraceae bacterium]|nr:hypothetical protein [Lachnospiraceae bacterium]
MSFWKKDDIKRSGRERNRKRSDGGRVFHDFPYEGSGTDRVDDRDSYEDADFYDDYEDEARRSDRVSAEEYEDEAREADTVSADEYEDEVRETDIISEEEYEDEVREANAVSADEYEDEVRESDITFEDEYEYEAREADAASAYEYEDDVPAMDTVRAETHKESGRMAAPSPADEYENDRIEADADLADGFEDDWYEDDEQWEDDADWADEDDWESEDDPYVKSETELASEDDAHRESSEPQSGWYEEEYGEEPYDDMGDYPEDEEDYDRGGRRGRSRGNRIPVPAFLDSVIKGRRSPSKKHVYFKRGMGGSFTDALGEKAGQVWNWLSGMDRMDRIVALTGVFVAIISLVTCSMYAQAQSVRKQVDSFSSVGDAMADISMIGESGIDAVAEAAREKAVAAEAEAAAEAESEALAAAAESEESGEVTVKLKVTTIQSDLKIKFVDNERGKLIEGVPFGAEASSSAETLDLNDDDQDGIIYVKDVKNGKYTVTVKALTGSYAAKYLLPTSGQTVNVTDTIAYKKVDVSDEIKTEAQVNAKAEDTAKNDTVVESTLTDTVAWVESTKTEGGDQVTYTQTNSISTPSSSGDTVSSNSDSGGNALTDTNGNRLYYFDGSNYIEATWQDYWSDSGRAYYTRSASYVYTGWQTIGGYTYYFTADHNFVTGEQVIQGAKYNFDSLGHLQASSGQLGIDVSKWNGAIDWNQVKNSGVSFAIIRCGYRGSSTGALIEDPTFRTNISGAKAAGISVGIYFFTQAINEAEAVEEASMAVTLASGYGLNLPIYMDVESSGGRGDLLTTSARTAVCSAFLRTVQASGYSGGIYGNKTWLTSKIGTGSLASYSIWLAQYAAVPTYTATRYDLWQYTSKGRVSGISGNVDMNIRYR